MGRQARKQHADSVMTVSSTSLGGTPEDPWRTNCGDNRASSKTPGAVTVPVCRLPTSKAALLATQMVHLCGAVALRGGTY